MERDSTFAKIMDTYSLLIEKAQQSGNAKYEGKLLLDRAEFLRKYFKLKRSITENLPPDFAMLD